MANSFQTHTGNGSTATFSWAQIDGYLSSAHIYVYINGVVKTITSDYTINTTAKTITFTAGNIPSSGDYIEIKRITPKTVAGLQVNFTDASVLTATDMNNSQKQQLFIAQEAQDTGAGGMGLNAGGVAWDAENIRIERVSAPTNLTDAVNKQYVDTLSLFGAFTVPQSWSFNGTGSATAFTLTNPAPSCTDPAMFIVEVNGVIQRPTDNYTIAEVGGNYQIQFTAAPSAGTGNILVRNFGVARSALSVLPNESVTAQYIGTGAVETAKILDSAVTTAKIDALAVTEAKIGAGAVTNTKIGSSAVGSTQIAASAVITAKINDLAVTTAKINDLAVTTGKLDNLAVTNAKVAAAAISFDQLKASGFTGAGSDLRLLNANTSGNLQLTTPSSIPLSSLAVPTTTVNMNSQTFSNLLQAQFTPTVFLGSTEVSTYLNQFGRYIKIGRLVMFTIYVQVNAKGAGTGNVTIRGIPFNAQTSGWAPVSVLAFSNFLSLTGAPVGYIDPAITGQIQLRQTSATGVSALTHSNIDTSASFYIAGCVIADA